MILDMTLPLLLFAAAFVITIVARTHEGGRHARCLANIARLERELGIGRVSGEPLDYEIGPGVVWRVDDPAAIGYLSESAPPAAQQWGIEHGMVYEEEAREAQRLLVDMNDTNRAIMGKQLMARNLFYSAYRKAEWLDD